MALLTTNTAFVKVEGFNKIANTLLLPINLNLYTAKVVKNYSFSAVPFINVASVDSGVTANSFVYPQNKVVHDASYPLTNIIVKVDEYSRGPTTGVDAAVYNKVIKIYSNSVIFNADSKKGSLTFAWN